MRGVAVCSLWSLGAQGNATLSRDGRPEGRGGRYGCGGGGGGGGGGGDGDGDGA